MTDVSLPLVLISGITSFGLFIFLMSKANDKRAKILATFCFSLSLYSLSYYFANFANSLSIVFFLDKLSLIGAIFSVATFMNFTFVYVNKEENQISELWYLFAIILSLLTISNKVIVSISLDPFEETLGLGYSLFMVLLIFTYVFSMYYYIKYYIETKSKEEKRRTKYLLFFFSILSAAAAIDMLRLTETLVLIDILLLQYAIILFTFGITYTILKYKLLDIKLIIHKSAKYTVIAMIVIFIFELIKMIMDEFFSSLLSDTYSSKITLIMLTFLFEPIRNKTEKFFDKLFLKK